MTIKNELVCFLKDLIPPLTPVLILGAFALFVASASFPMAAAVVPILLVAALFTVVVIAPVQD